MKERYKIGEIASLYSIGTDSLRYYEETRLLIPKRDENGYRMYEIEDIWRLNVIRDMLRLDFSTRQIKEHLDSRSVLSTLAMFSQEKTIVDRQVKELLAIRGNIERREKTLNEALSFALEFFELRTLPERRFVILKGKPRADAEIDFMLKKLHKRYEDELSLIRDSDTGLLMPLSCIEKGIYSQYSHAFIERDEGEEYDLIVPAGEFATVRYSGPYTQTVSFMPQLVKYAEKQGRSACGDALELYLVDIHETENIGEYITELQLPVRENALAQGT